MHTYTLDQHIFCSSYISNFLRFSFNSFIFQHLNLSTFLRHHLNIAQKTYNQSFTLDFSSFGIFSLYVYFNWHFPWGILNKVTITFLLFSVNLRGFIRAFHKEVFIIPYMICPNYAIFRLWTRYIDYNDDDRQTDIPYFWLTRAYIWSIWVQDLSF